MNTFGTSHKMGWYKVRLPQPYPSRAIRRQNSILTGTLCFNMSNVGKVTNMKSGFSTWQLREWIVFTLLLVRDVL